MFALAFVVGVVLHDDYGVSWDEPDYYHYGELLLRFYDTGARDFETFSNLRYYGGSIALLHAAVAAIVDPSPAGAAHLAHLVNFAVFFAGLVAFYGLLMLQTGRRGWALFGTAVLALSPRLLSHAFVNPKDSPFLAVFVITIYLLVRYLERRQWWALLAAGSASAVLVNIRVVGFLAVAMVIAAVVLDEATATAPRSLQDRALALLRAGGLYALGFLPPLLALWPYLWPAPRSRFFETMRVMSEFVGAGGAAYMGQSIPTTDLPWHYIPVWIAITTPIPYLVLAAGGLLATLIRTPAAWLRAFRDRSPDRHYLMYLAWLVVAPVLTVLMGSKLYDEWRQLTFVYPALVLFAVAGGMAVERALRRNGATRRLVAAIPLVPVVAAIALLPGAIAVARLHPFEALYFNALAGGTGGAEHRFELDYWGISYRHGLQELLDEVPGTVVVYPCTNPGRFNAVLLPSDERERLRFVDTADEADYIICAPRESWIGLGGQPEIYAEYDTVLEIERDGGTFLYVKDVRGESPTS